MFRNYWHMLACNNNPIFNIHRTALDWIDEIEALFVGEGQILLAVASVSLSSESEGD